MSTTGNSQNEPAPTAGVHLATASALAAVLGAVPAALLNGYKIISIGVGIVTMILYLIVAAVKLKESFRTLNRKAALAGAVVLAFVASWSITAWELYHANHNPDSTQQKAVAPAPVSVPVLNAPAPAPGPATINNIQNSGTGNPIITGSNGPIYIGTASGSEARRQRKSDAKTR